MLNLKTPVKLSGQTGSIVGVSSTGGQLLYPGVNLTAFGGGIAGGSNSSDDLVLYANTAQFAQGNIGRIRARERMVFDSNFSVNSAFVEAFIKTTGTVTSTFGLTAAIGYLHAITLSYNTTQVFSAAPAFSAAPVYQPTTSTSDTASYFMGFASGPIFTPGTSGITPTTPNLMGYQTAPKVNKGISSSATVTTITCYGSYGTPVFGAFDWQDATVGTLIHFIGASPLASGATTCGTQIVLKVQDSTFATNNYGILSLLNTNSGANLFINHTGTANSVHASSISIGKSSAPNLACDVSSGFINYAGAVRVSTTFNKAANTTLADVTGLSVTVVSGRVYRFRAVLFVDSDAVGGQKYAISGTATATAIIYNVNTISNTTNTLVITSRQTALGGSVGQAGATSNYTEINGLITVNAAGTLTVQFAQNAASGTSSVLVGSTFDVWDVV